ncbi:MAG: hypothetical protein AAFN50_01945 [Pseudomonadota bacterium]
MATLFEKIVVVTRQTELDELVHRFNTPAQARFWLEQSGHSFDRIQKAHDKYRNVVSSVVSSFTADQKHQVIDRSIVPQFSFASDDLVVTIGQDGLVSNTAKYLDGQPVFAINPDPDLYDGVLLPFNAGEFHSYLQATLKGESDRQNVTLARAKSSDGQELLAFNDFFIGARSHVSARYEIEVSGRSETHSSSGIIVSTGAGSTGWLQSVYAGAAGVITALGGTVTPPPDNGRLPWDSEQLVYSVREPFPSQVTQCSLVHGRLSAAEPLRLTSRMPANGVIFSDGVEADYLEFNSGASLTIAPAGKRTVLLTK